MRILFPKHFFRAVLEEHSSKQEKNSRSKGRKDWSKYFLDEKDKYKNMMILVSLINIYGKFYIQYKEEYQNMISTKSATQSVRNSVSKDQIHSLINSCRDSLSFFQQQKPIKKRIKINLNKEQQQKELKVQNLKSEMKRFLHSLSKKKDSSKDKTSQIIKISRPFEDRFEIKADIDKENSPEVQNTACFFLSDNLRIANKVKMYLQENYRKMENKKISQKREEDTGRTKKEISDFINMKNRTLNEELLEVLHKTKPGNRREQNLEKFMVLTDRNFDSSEAKSCKFIQRNHENRSQANSNWEENKPKKKSKPERELSNFNRRFRQYEPIMKKNELQTLNDKLMQKYPAQMKEKTALMTDQRFKALQQSYVIKNLRILENTYSEKQMMRQLNQLRKKYEVKQEDDEDVVKDLARQNNHFYVDMVQKMNPTHLLKQNKKLLRKERSKHISKLHL